MKNSLLSFAKLFTLVLSTTILFSFIAPSAAGDNWITIATKAVSYKSDKDVVKPNGKEKDIRKIKIKCTDGTLKLKGVKVTMSDGQKKDFKILVPVLKKGMATPQMDLPGRNNNLKEIELQYDSVGVILVTDRANVEIVGLK